MKPQDQIKAIAELDGVVVCEGAVFYETSKGDTCPICGLEYSKHWPRTRKDYPHSRDAIIPVIEKYLKQDSENWKKMQLAIRQRLPMKCDNVNWIQLVILTPLNSAKHSFAQLESGLNEN